MKDTVKQLGSQLSQLNSDIESLKIELSNKQKELNTKRKNYEELKNKIDKLKSSNNNEIVISEHAYLRYFQRVLKYDLDEIKNVILSDKVKNITKELGVNGTIPTGNTDCDGKEFRVVLKNNVVVTIGT